MEFPHLMATSGNLWEKENNDYAGPGKRICPQVNVKFRGSERFPVGKMMRPRKYLTSQKLP
jgi:hypothetical protein